MHEVSVNLHDSQVLFTNFFRKNVAQTNLTKHRRNVLT